MTNCETCKGEGLVHQGESIRRVCDVCAGTGKDVGPAEEASASAPALESVSAVSSSEESFLGEAGVDSVPA